MGNRTIQISKEVQFDAGHRIPNHNGKCRFPHGHRYRVVASCHGNIIEDPQRSDYGMLVDFGDLKHLMMKHIHDVLDHKFIVYEKDALMLQLLEDFAITSEHHYGCAVDFPYVPTAENIARWCYEQLSTQIKLRFENDLSLYSVQVWETPTSEATFYG